MRSPGDGFTRLELLACVAALALTGAVAWALVVPAGSESARAVCQNNLRQIGVAQQRWAGDHNDRAPWFVFVQDGGTKPVNFANKAPSAWFEFATLSNQLSSPRVLACPADEGVKVATNFSNGAGGFLNSGFRANALSYSQQFDSDYLLPRSLFASDRDFRGESGLANCPQGGTGVHRLSNQAPAGTAIWTNAVHANFGNALFADGSVESLDNAHFQSRVVTSDDNGSLHYAPAR